MKKEEILSVLNELHKISGLRVSLHGTDFEEIAAAPKEKLPFCAAIQTDAAEYKKCLDCDSEACKKVKVSGQTYIYRCRYGLMEAIAPLYNFGTLTGYLMIGQVADERVDLKRLELAIFEKTQDIHIARQISENMPVIKEEMLSAFVKIMTICAEYMTLTNVLPSNTPKTPELAKIYIHENYANKLTIKDICSALSCSKSALLTSFKAEYGTTVNSYISDLRVTEAKRLLRTTNLSMSEIADATGFYDQSYFSKVFLQKTSTTPSEYRKEKDN